jgi:hypothetical protein
VQPRRGTPRGRVPAARTGPTRGRPLPIPLLPPHRPLRSGRCDVPRSERSHSVGASPARLAAGPVRSRRGERRSLRGGAA